MVNNCSDPCSEATGHWLSLFETIFAKEAKKRKQLSRKTPRPACICRIAVCTQWQSGNAEASEHFSDVSTVTMRGGL